MKHERHGLTELEFFPDSAGREIVLTSTDAALLEWVLREARKVFDDPVLRLRKDPSGEPFRGHVAFPIRPPDGVHWWFIKALGRRGWQFASYHQGQSSMVYHFRKKL